MASRSSINERRDEASGESGKREEKTVPSAGDELFLPVRGGKMFSLSFDSSVPVVDRSYLFTYHRFSLFASPRPAGNSCTTHLRFSDERVELFYRATLMHLHPSFAGGVRETSAEKTVNVC